MATLKLRMLKAKHGDCFFIFSDQKTLLIDGGPSGVYRDFLRPHLQSLGEHSFDPPEIDLMMVSHIDADHIDGILDLTAELIESREESSAPIARIQEAWHNSFADVIANQTTINSTNVRAEAASARDVFLQYATRFQSDGTNLVLSSVSQGRQLRLDLNALNIDLNRGFKDRIISQHARTESGARPWRSGDLEVHVIGPTQKEIEGLRKVWKKALEKMRSNEENTALAAARKLDKSVSNLASIVCVVTSGDKSILLTGDARGDNILQWLREVNWPRTNGVFRFDAIKLPHHGSDRNVDEVFFQQVIADHYLISGNGGHGNPEPHTFDLLFNARPDLDYQIYLSYGPDELKTNNTFIREGNSEALDRVLSADRRQVLHWPDPNQDFLDISL